MQDPAPSAGCIRFSNVTHERARRDVHARQIAAHAFWNQVCGSGPRANKKKNERTGERAPNHRSRHKNGTAAATALLRVVRASGAAALTVREPRENAAAI